MKGYSQNWSYSNNQFLPDLQLFTEETKLDKISRKQATIQIG